MSFHGSFWELLPLSAEDRSRDIDDAGRLTNLLALASSLFEELSPLPPGVSDTDDLTDLSLVADKRVSRQEKPRGNEKARNSGYALGDFLGHKASDLTRRFHY